MFVRRRASNCAPGSRAANRPRVSSAASGFERDFGEAVRIPAGSGVAQTPAAFVADDAGNEQHHDRRAIGDAQQFLEERQRRLVGPVQIVQRDDQRVLFCQSREEFSGGPKGLLLANLRGQLCDPGPLFAEFQSHQVRQEGDGVHRLLFEQRLAAFPQREEDVFLGGVRGKPQHAAQHLRREPVVERLAERHRLRLRPREAHRHWVVRTSRS